MTPKPFLPNLPSRRRLLALGAASLALTGCGFRLRQTPQFAFQSIYLQLPAGSQLRQGLVRALAFSPQLMVVADTGDIQSADVVLEVVSEGQEKVVAGMNAAGQVREFVLRLRVRFRLRTPRGREIIPLTELLLERELGFAEPAALAKAEEEALLYRDMRLDVQQQILRRLAAVRDLQAVPAPQPR